MSGAVTAAVVGGSIAAGAGLAGSAISSSAAGNAASTQANAANQSAALQYQASQNALGFQEQQYNTNQQNLQPWLQSGVGGLSNLDYLLGIGGQSPQSFNSQAAPGTNTPFQASTGNPSVQAAPGTQAPAGGFTNPNGPTVPQSQAYAVPTNSGSNSFSPGGQASPVGGGNIASSPISAGQIPQTPGTSGQPSVPNGVNPSLGSFGSLMTPYSQTFQAPTGLTEQNDPGYQARLQLGTDALQHSAAARGSLLTGGTAKALDTYAQDYASNEYGNVYNRALNTFGTNYNVYNQNQTNQYNRLASLAGIGQQTAQQLGTAGQAASNNVSSNLLGTAANMGQQYNNAAAATASGYVGGANAWSSGLGGIGNNVSNLALLQSLGGYGSSNNGAGNLAAYQGYGGPASTMDTGDYTNLGYIS